MKYTREQLEGMGFNVNQIEAIFESAKEEQEVNNAVTQMDKKEKVVTFSGNESLKVTTLSDLQMYKKGSVVRFPDFAEGQPFVARVRRPSMLVLAKQGKIPNALLNAASDLFTKGGSGLNTNDTDMLSQVYDICKIMCESALIEPTMQEIESVGLELSDEQMMAVFNYTQYGVKALESFR